MVSGPQVDRVSSVGGSASVNESESCSERSNAATGSAAWTDAMRSSSPSHWAGVKRLALTHHDPLRDDAAVERVLVAVRADLGAQASALEVFAAAEGQDLELHAAVDSYAGIAKSLLDARL